MVGKAASPARVAVKVAAALALAVVLSWYPSAARAVTSASLTSSSTSVNAGSPVTLTLSDSFPSTDNPDPSNIAGIDLQVTFDSSLLSFDGVANGPLISDWGSPFADTSLGTISIALDNGTDLSNNQGDLLTLTFHALGSDASTSATTITVGTNSSVCTLTGDPSGFPPSCADAEEYWLAPISDTIGITARAVPAPGLACLLLPALALIRIKTRASGRKTA